MVYREFRGSVPAEAAEALAGVLADLAGGCEVLDGGEGRTGFRFWVPAEAAAACRARLAEALERARSFFPRLEPVAWEERDVPEEAWAEAWRAHFRPVRVGRRLLVAPPWEEPRRFPGEVVVRVDPGPAFGTGTHPSTVLCLEALEALVPGGRQGVDVGTGSGILAVAAVHLGAERVWAVDIDPVAVRVAKANAAANGVSDRVVVRYGELGDLLAEGVAGVAWVVANLTAEALVALANSLAEVLQPGGTAVVSGIVPAGEPKVVEALEAAGLRVLRRAALEGWLALWARRP
jgi:ribosomal protein L11 methyltransferase